MLWSYGTARLGTTLELTFSLSSSSRHQKPEHFARFETRLRPQAATPKAVCFGLYALWYCIRYAV